MDYPPAVSELQAPTGGTGDVQGLVEYNVLDDGTAFDLFRINGNSGVSDDQAVLHPMSRYVGLLDGLEADKQQLNAEQEIIVALNDVAYAGPLSIEWEDSRMDREHGAAESCEFVKKIDFPSSDIVFDAQFAEN